MSPPFFPFGRGQLPNKRQYLTERVRQRFSPFRPCLCSAEEMIVMTQILVVVCVMNINLPSPWTIPLFELKSGNNLLGTPLLPYLASLILETHLEHRSEFILWMRMVIHLFIQLFFFWNSGKKEIASSPQKGRFPFKSQKPFLGDNNVFLFCVSVGVCRY